MVNLVSFGESHAGGETEWSGGDVFRRLVCCLLVILKAVEVLVSFLALVANVLLLLDDGVREAVVQGQGGTAGC
jgi:hypothetical protein